MGQTGFFGLWGARVGNCGREFAEGFALRPLQACAQNRASIQPHQPYLPPRQVRPLCIFLIPSYLTNQWQFVGSMRRPCAKPAQNTCIGMDWLSVVKSTGHLAFWMQVLGHTFTMRHV
ncbi:unnamed protein product [Effrenium voratum]|uniref:Uncharacterized protein n=1 Tax=Effrenium voratum TaxID=2562239 RepID=A0AA36J4B5_9DINO|nr:unnamed protein product [Effrenium voratum]